ncbi:MAG: nucleotidyltransferase family protein [Eubacterium sp.]|nr:nucleotidyltransferase family protein [Eubacterium sp.]
MKNETGTINLIKFTLWGIGKPEADEGVFSDLKDHTLIALPADLLTSMNLSEELAARWKNEVLQHLMSYFSYKEQEKELPLTVPYVLMKGSAAGQYYPKPEYRSMGDIDLITKSEDFETACNDMLSGGYEEIPCYYSRHRQFIKNNIVVEVHRSFAIPDNPERARRVDQLIRENINESHFLPDLVNGIVLLEHIRYHLKMGLGLRQILDWMLFADKCLPDEKWPEFQAMAGDTDLEKLAVATTRMCELYLGLPEHEWCRNADKKVCRQLMNLVLDSGNFARNFGHDGFVSSQFFTSAKTLKGALAFLQSRGDWHLEQEYGHKPIPIVGGLYQLGRYLVQGFHRKGTFRKLLTEYRVGKERNDLFDALLEDHSAGESENIEDH